MITLRNLTSPAETSSTLGVDAISLSIGEGESVAVTGLSAVGRRRFLAVLALHFDDWEGEYQLFGHQVHKLDNSKRASVRAELIGALMKSAPLVECLTVEENLEIPLTYQEVPLEERSRLIGEALGRFGIGAIREDEVDGLPPDQSQLVGIAKALVSNPRLILLEEPRAHLSPLQLRLVGRELDRLRQDGRVIVQSVEKEESGLDVDRVVDLSELASGRRKAKARSSRDRLDGVVGLC